GDTRAASPASQQRQPTHKRPPTSTPTARTGKILLLGHSVAFPVSRLLLSSPSVLLVSCPVSNTYEERAGRAGSEWTTIVWNPEKQQQQRGLRQQHRQRAVLSRFRPSFETSARDTKSTNDKARPRAGATRTRTSARLARLLDAGEQLQPTSSAPPPPPPPPPGAPGAPLKASVPERPNTEEGQGSRTIAGAAARAGAVTATAAAAEASASAEPEITTGTVKAITAVTTAIAPGTEARANPERAAAVAGPAVTVVRPPFSSATGTGNAAAAAAAAAADNSGSSSGDSRAAGAPPALTSGGAKRKLGPERTREGRSESPQKFALSGNNVGGGGGGSGGAVGKRLSGE
ncbi:unnamed protein product, partial [Pylaiella littoralis]